MSKCVGCGALLQSDNSKLPGYVKDLDYKYCERCFRNIFYSETKEEANITLNDDIISKVNEDSSLTFFVVDFLNINNDVINLYDKITTNKYLVINKIDILPKDISFNKITNLLDKVYKVKDNVLFTSVKNNNLTNYFANNKKIYFVGLSNSGKTSLVSKISGNDKLTKSSMINTTLDYLNINYLDYTLVDSPGFIIDNNIMDNKYQKIINPSKRLKIRNYNLKDNTTLNIHDLFKITFNDSNNVSCYLSNGLLIKKEYQDIDNYIELKVSDNCDLIIKGIGFLNIKRQGIVKIPNNLKYELRSSIF